MCTPQLTEYPKILRYSYNWLLFFKLTRIRKNIGLLNGFFFKSTQQNIKAKKLHTKLPLYLMYLSTFTGVGVLYQNVLGQKRLIIFGQPPQKPSSKCWIIPSPRFSVCQICCGLCRPYSLTHWQTYEIKSLQDAFKSTLCDTVSEVVLRKSRWAAEL